jgi:hypothetical protein
LDEAATFLDLVFLIPSMTVFFFEDLDMGWVVTFDFVVEAAT